MENRAATGMYTCIPRDTRTSGGRVLCENIYARETCVRWGNETRVYMCHYVRLCKFVTKCDGCFYADFNY